MLSKALSCHLHLAPANVGTFAATISFSGGEWSR